MQTSKQPFPPDFVYLLHAAARHPLPERSASDGGDEDDADGRDDGEDADELDYDDED